jgi:hypothetical protein
MIRYRCQYATTECAHCHRPIAMNESSGPWSATDDIPVGLAPDCAHDPWTHFEVAPDPGAGNGTVKMSQPLVSGGGRRAQQRVPRQIIPVRLSGAEKPPVSAAASQAGLAQPTYIARAVMDAAEYRAAPGSAGPRCRAGTPGRGAPGPGGGPAERHRARPRAGLSRPDGGTAERPAQGQP